MDWVGEWEKLVIPDLWGMLDGPELPWGSCGPLNTQVEETRKKGSKV